MSEGYDYFSWLSITKATLGGNVKGRPEKYPYFRDITA